MVSVESFVILFLLFTTPNSQVIDVDDGEGENEGGGEEVGEGGGGKVSEGGCVWPSFLQNDIEVCLMTWYYILLQLLLRYCIALSCCSICC